MSQVQIQTPSAALAGSQILNKTPSLSQPLSIPSTTSSLPSENAGRPIQNSALPSASVTSTSAAAAPSNMANPKEKTPMCLVNELARFNKIQPEYKLLSEQGPAHSKVFTVQLTLGDQHWEAEGTSIKKAQHAAAAKALEGTKFPKPTARPSRSEGKNPGNPEKDVYPNPKKKQIKKRTTRTKNYVRNLVTAKNNLFHGQMNELRNSDRIVQKLDKKDFFRNVNFKKPKEVYVVGDGTRTLEFV